ncbi:MAG: sensor domain-containing diguanylate cyclase [Firmicutes bacterium]|nr:sensor domain-containing diguanylate cyclase [Bacillota bacterium]
MSDFSKKAQTALTVAEITLLAAFFLLVEPRSIKYMDAASSMYAYMILLGGTAAVLAARLALTRKLFSSPGAPGEEDRKLAEDLREANWRLETEKKELEKEFQAFKVNHDRISKNVAELFTLKVVSDTINSTLELDRLLNTVNDIIIGIMGVNTCTICIFEENQKGVRYLVTNEKRKDLLESIRIRALYYLENKERLDEKILVNEVSGFDPVTRISFTPVTKNKVLMGAIITGHTEDNLFDTEDIRFMEIICNQISMAIENAKLYEKVNTMANTDFLTGLYNRTYFFNYFEKILANLPEDKLLAVSMFDIDNFKIVNDRYGHDFGDVVLVDLARTVKNMIRKDDVFARYGGEEFILVMQNISMEKAHERLNQIREAIQDCVFDHNGNSLSVTVSIGVAFYHKGRDNHETIIKKADIALYAAKKNGKNRIEEFSGELES